MKVVKTGHQTWENRHEIFVEDIHDLYELGNEAHLDALEAYNDCTKGYQNLIKESVATGIPLRALGGGWSWTKIATVNKGIMLDTKPLNTVFNITAKSINSSYNKDPKYLLFAQSGICVWELNKYLKSRGQSIKTSGASNGQTIAGAVSTGTHGSAFDFGATPDFVVGLHIVTGANKHVYLERASAPVVSTKFIENFETELIQDDDLFNAALVSFGSFGIIHGMLIETEDLFLLETYMTRVPYDQSLKDTMRTLDFTNATNLPCGTERPFHFSVLLNPYDLDKGAFVTTMYKRTYRTDYQPPTDNGSGIGPGDDAAAFMGMVTEALPGLVPMMVTKVLSANFTLFDKQFGTSGEIFNNTTLRGKLLSAAIGVPIDRINEVADLMLQINEDIGPFSGVYSFRFVKRTTATLGFTRYPHTCVLELDAPLSTFTYNFYSKVWKMLEDHQIPFTFHWGKMSELTPQRIDRMYGADVGKWVAARNKLLDADARKIFNNPILQQWGLDTVLP